MGRKRLNNDGLPERVYLHHGAYVYKPLKGKQVRLCAGRGDVEREYAKLVKAGLVVSPTHEALVHGARTLDNAITRYKVEELPKLAAETQRVYGKYLEEIRKAFGAARPEQVKPSMIYAFCDRVSSSKGVHHIISAIFRTLYRYMIEWGWADVNPAREVRKPNGRARKVSPDATEIAAFKASAVNPVIPIYVDFKLAYGLRQKDILELPPILLNSIEFTREISKSRRWNDEAGARVGKVETYAITEETRDILRRLYALKRPQSTKALFTNDSGRKYTLQGFRDVWGRAMNRYLREVPGATRFHEHDLRATTATADPENAQQRLTHERRTTTDAYLRGFDSEVIKPLELAKIRAKGSKVFASSNQKKPEGSAG